MHRSRIGTMIFHHTINFYAVLFLFCLSMPNAVTLKDVRVPPTIVKGPLKDSQDYRDEDNIALDCVATGTPKPEYEWLKDDKLMTNLGSVRHIAEGTIEITQLSILDEGTYQCRAYNQYGTALSRKIVLKRAVLAQYLSKTIYDVPTQMEGTPFMMSCLPTKWYPKPIFSWMIVETAEGEDEKAITTDSRVQMDEEGNLHFAYLLEADSQNNKLYKCKLFNNIMDMTIGGSYTRLKVTPVSQAAPFPPAKMFSTKSPLIGLEKQQMSIRCFFSGRPEPFVTFTKEGASLPISRYTLNNKLKELTIRDLQQSDAGNYSCNAQNTQSQNVSEIIQVIIEAVPEFRVALQQPHDVNVTEGSDIVIVCKAYAKPAANVQWYKNGEKIDLSNLPRKFRLSEDGETLTISELCKNCKDGTSDLMVIQCNASNVHGYAFADGYINVIEKTVITKVTGNTSLSVEEYETELIVDAKTDDSTELMITWYKITDDDQRYILQNDESYVIISDDKKRVKFNLPHNGSKRSQYDGKYEVVANNSYSIASEEVYLHIDELPPSPEPPSSSHAGIAELWWIIVVVAGVFLLFLLILLCCLCCYRNRGDVYPVDKKERKNGNDPEKELADSGFYDYKRPDVQPVKGSQMSLTSSISVSDEEGSLNEYGDTDAGKFTEEGSFIGDYVNGRPLKNSTSRPSKA